MIYSGQTKKGKSTIESRKLWRMTERPKTWKFEQVSGNESLIVNKDPSKIGKSTWQYVRPLYEESWVIFDKYDNVYYFDWGVDNSIDLNEHYNTI